MRPARDLENLRQLGHALHARHQLGQRDHFLIDAVN